MKLILLLLVAICIALVGCSSTQVTAPKIDPGLDARAVLIEKLKEHGLAPLQKASSCAPDPLPEVGYTVGTVMGSGTIKVPVWMDSQGHRSQGGLLFLQYDDKHMTFTGVEPGEAWKDASFAHAAVNDQVPGRALFLIVGWELDDAGHAIGLSQGNLLQPWAYVVFESVKPGKSKVEWDPVPNPAPVFYRRGEVLLDVLGLDWSGRPCVWSVVDWYRSSPNSTGRMTVEPGYAVVTGKNKIATDKMRAILRLVKRDDVTYQVRANTNFPFAGGDFRFHTDQPLASVDRKYDTMGVNFFFEEMGHVIVDVVRWDREIRSGVVCTMTFAEPPGYVRWVTDTGLPGIETNISYVAEDGYGYTVPMDQITFKD